MDMPDAEKGPAFGGIGTSFLDFERRDQLWMRATGLGPASRAPLLVLHMNSVPRQGRPSPGGSHLDDWGVVTRFFGILRRYFALEAAGAIYRQVMRFSQYLRAEQPIGDFFARSYPLRR